MTDHDVFRDPLRVEKKQLRKELTALRNSIAPDARQKLSLAACRRFLTLAEYKVAETVLLYAPIRSELDVWSVFDDALANGKTVGLPRCGVDSQMEFYHVKSRADLVKGAYNIPEPSENCPLLVREMLSERGSKVVCLVPGVAFDRKGYRMGYGGGYYDRYLADFNGIRIGITYAALLRESIPKETFDHQMNMVITNEETLYF